MHVDDLGLQYATLVPVDDRGVEGVKMYQSSCDVEEYTYLFFPTKWWSTASIRLLVYL